MSKDERFEASNFTKNLATTGLNPTEEHVVKATFDDDSVPKEKHVLALIRLAERTNANDLNLLLMRRIATKHYRVIIKTLMVFHRLTRDGPLRVIESLPKYLHAFDTLLRFQDRDANPQSRRTIVYTRLIRLYTQYWHQKIAVFNATQLHCEKHSPLEAKTWITQLRLNVDASLVLLQGLQQQLDTLLKVDPLVPILEPNIKCLFTLLLRDCMRVYNCISILMFTSLESIEQMDRPQSAVYLQCCINSTSLDERLHKWHDGALRIQVSKQPLPAFQKMPDNIMQMLHERLYALDIDHGEAPGQGRALGLSAAISTTVEEANKAIEIASKRAIATPSSISLKANNAAFREYTNKNKNQTNAGSVDTEKLDDFTFDDMDKNDEWTFNDQQQQQNQQQNHQPDPFGPYGQQQQHQQIYPQQPQIYSQQQQQPQQNDPFATTANQAYLAPVTYPQITDASTANPPKDPFDIFDAFSDPVPPNQAGQIKTTTNNNNNNNDFFALMQQQPAQVPQSSQQQVYHSPQLQQQQQLQQRPQSVQQQQYQLVPAQQQNVAYDDPFSGLINQQPHAQPVMMVPMYQSPYQQPTNASVQQTVMYQQQQPQQQQYQQQPQQYQQQPQQYQQQPQQQYQQPQQQYQQQPSQQQQAFLPF